MPQSILAKLGLCTWVCVAAAASCALTLANIVWVIVVYESAAARHVCIYLYKCMSLLERVMCAYVCNCMSLLKRITCAYVFSAEFRIFVPTYMH